MSDPVWPTTLPQVVLLDGLSESPPDQSIETPTDAGPGKSRRRQTGTQRAISASIICTKAQVATFDIFWLTTLASGTLNFSWTAPRTGAAATMRFRKPPPSYAALGGGQYRIDMALWIL